MMFGVKPRRAASLLRALGYIQRGTKWFLDKERRDSVEKDLQYTKKVISSKADKSTPKKWIKQKISTFVKNVIYKLQNIEDKMGDNEHRCITPVYKQYEARNYGVIFIIVGIIVIIAAFIGINSIDAWMTEKNGVQEPSVFAQILFSIITLLVGVVTTFLTMRQTRKIDYHKERLSVIPIFTAKAITVTEGKVNEKGKEKRNSQIFKSIIKKESVGYYDLTWDYKVAIIMCIRNDGNGPAYDVEIESVWDDGTNADIGSFSKEQEKYILLNEYQFGKIQCCYHDLYGNYYVQSLKVADKPKGIFFDVSSDPPVLVLRTKRLRYVQ